MFTPKMLLSLRMHRAKHTWRLLCTMTLNNLSSLVLLPRQCQHPPQHLLPNQRQCQSQHQALLPNQRQCQSRHQALLRNQRPCQSQHQALLPNQCQFQFRLNLLEPCSKQLCKQLVSSPSTQRCPTSFIQFAQARFLTKMLSSFTSLCFKTSATTYNSIYVSTQHPPRRWSCQAQLP